MDDRRVRLLMPLIQQAPGGLGGGGGALGPSTLILSIIDLPLADPAEPLFRHRVRDASWTFDDTTSFADAGVAATGSPVLRLRKNGVQVGTITFSGTAGTVDFTTPGFVLNDVFEIYPPSSVDATLDQLSVSLAVTIV